MKDVYVNQSCMDASCTGPWLWSSAWFSLLGLFGHTAFSNRPGGQPNNLRTENAKNALKSFSQTPRWQTQHLTVVRHAPEARELCTPPIKERVPLHHYLHTFVPGIVFWYFLIPFDFFGCDVFLFALTAYVGHMLQGMRIVECGNCRTPQCQA